MPLARQRDVGPARSHLAVDEGRVQRPFVLFFSFLPQSTLQAGAPLPTPAAATAFVEALPPNQTPFVRETAARGSSAGTDAPVSPSKQTLSHPPSRRAAHPHRCHAACLGLLPSVQDGGVTEPYLPSYIPVPSPMSTPGLLCGSRSRSQHLGCPVTPPTLGVAGRCCCPGGVCTAVRASRMDLLSLLTIPIPRATAELLPAGRNPEPLEAEAATPCDPVHTGDDAD